MPWWLDLLRTPMAAPETPGLRRLRFIWLGLCLVLAIVVVAQPPLRAIGGPAAPIAAALLLFATILHGIVYFVLKARADTAWLGRAAEEPDA